MWAEGKVGWWRSKLWLFFWGWAAKDLQVKMFFLGVASMAIQIVISKCIRYPSNTKWVSQTRGWSVQMWWHQSSQLCWNMPFVVFLLVCKSVYRRSFVITIDYFSDALIKYLGCWMHRSCVDCVGFGVYGCSCVVHSRDTGQPQGAWQLETNKAFNLLWTSINHWLAIITRWWTIDGSQWFTIVQPLVTSINRHYQPFCDHYQSSSTTICHY